MKIIKINLIIAFLMMLLAFFIPALWLGYAIPLILNLPIMIFYLFTEPKKAVYFMISLILILLIGTGSCFLVISSGGM